MFGCFSHYDKLVTLTTKLVLKKRDKSDKLKYIFCLIANCNPYSLSEIEIFKVNITKCSNQFHFEAAGNQAKPGRFLKFWGDILYRKLISK